MLVEIFGKAPFLNILLVERSTKNISCSRFVSLKYLCKSNCFLENDVKMLTLYK